MYTEMSQAKRIFFDASAHDDLELPNARNIWRGPERRADAQQSPSWFSLILDELDYGMILLDCRLKVQFANRAALAQLASLRLLVVEQGGQRYILPLFSIREILGPGSHPVHSIAGSSQFLTVRGRSVPVSLPIRAVRLLSRRPAGSVRRVSWACGPMPS